MEVNEQMEIDISFPALAVSVIIMDFKAVVVDVDGTLTEADRRINLDAVMVLRKLEEKGIPVIIATGNVLPIAWGLRYFIGLSGP